MLSLVVAFLGDFTGKEKTITLLGLVTSGSEGTPAFTIYLPIGSVISDLTVRT